jgi:hypothetical protein
LIRLALALFCLCSGAQAETTLKFSGAMRWELDAPWFGGWSGIEVRDQGTRMTIVSDRGELVDAVLQRSGGQLTGIGVQSRTGLKNAKGVRLDKRVGDAEGLAIGADGTPYLSFEHRHRIMQVDLSTGRTGGRIDLPFKDMLGDNAGVEALAIGPDGTLFALPEKAPDAGKPFPLYAYQNGDWRIAARIPQRGPFVPVGADLDPSGRLWLLERAATPLGFRSRVRMFVLDPANAREYTLMTSFPARFDNLEGISVWQDAQGQLHVTMISDDNFFRIQRTQIVEFTVVE